MPDRAVLYGPAGLPDIPTPPAIPSTSGLTQAQVDDRIATKLAAAVTGNTETGIDVTYQTDNTFDFVVSATGALFRIGSGVPDSTLGDDDDTYLDSDAGTIYAKASGAWTLQYTISASGGSTFRFGTGDPGSTLGSDGDVYTDTDNGKIHSKSSGSWSLDYTPSAHTEQRVLDAEDHPAYDEDSRDKIVVGDGQARLTEITRVRQTNPTGTWTTFAHADFVGVRASDPATGSVGEWYFNSHNRHFLTVTSVLFGSPIWEDAAPQGHIGIPSAARFRGSYGSNALGLSHVERDGDLYFNINSNDLRQVSSFVAGTAASVFGEAKRLARADELPSLPPSASQSEAEAGTVTENRLFTPQRVSQAIAALAPADSGGLDIEAYSSTATYSRGSDNSLVTHSNGLFLYISSTERSSNHDPDNFPGYWLELSEGVTYEVITTGSHRISARTVVINGDNDNVYLCTTTQTTPRDLTYIHSQSESVGGAFILLNGGGGTTVAANPSGTEGDDLTRITIGGTDYNIAGGGGGGAVVETTLLSGTFPASDTEDGVEVTLDHDVADFSGGWLELLISGYIPAYARYDLLLATRATGQADAPVAADIPDAAVELPLAREATSLGSTGASSLYIYRSDEANKLWIAVPGNRHLADTFTLKHLSDGGGTSVTANPTGTDGSDLTRLAIDGTNYNLPAGSGGGSGDVTGIDAGTGIRIDDGDTATPEVNVADDGVDTVQLADGAVTTVKLADDAVTGDKIADATIHGGALIDGTIATGKIGDSQVTGAKLSGEAVSTGKIADDAVTQAKIADNAVGTDQTVDLAVTLAKLAANAAGEGKVPIDNTMQFDSDGDLGVNTQRVVQEVSEWVQHFASGDSHDTSGHTGKYHEYTSSNTVRRVGSVQYDFTPANSDGSKTYRVYIIQLTGRNVDAVLGVSQTYSGNNLQHRFHFTDGVLVNPAVRIGIGLHRTDGGGNNYDLSVRAGTESQNSPRESYDDASNDFHFEGRFNHDRNFPSVGDTVGGTTANQIYGNPEIFYQIIHTHASLVGDGTVGVSHLSSGSSADGTVATADGSGGVAFEALPEVADNRLVPDGGTDGQVLTKASGTDYDADWEDAPAGSGGGDGSGGASIGTSIGTHRMVNSYTTSRMYATTVPTPAAADGDLLMITFSPDSTSPDNAEGGSEVAFVPLDNILAIPNAYSGSSSADSEGSNRDALRTGFGQNDWLYLGVTALVGGNLTIGSTDAKYAGVFTFRILTYGTSSEAPGNEESDSTITGFANAFIVTDLDVPSDTWGFVNIGDYGEYRAGAWHRFLVADLTGLADVAAGTAPSDANSLLFPIDAAHDFYLGQTSGDKIAVATGSPDKIPGNLRVRSN